MSSPVYASEADVYEASGFTTEVVQRVTGKSSAEVTTMINSYLVKAEQKVKDALEIPHVVDMEVHYGTGEDDEFDLGPEDEDFYVDYTALNCVENVIHCYFGRVRRKRCYPKNCDDITEDKDLWDATGYVQPTEEGTIKKANDYSMKFTFTLGNLKARYPNVSGDKYIDKNIDIFSYMFSRVYCNTDSVVLTIRLYDAAGNYNTATYTISKKNHWYPVMLYIDEDFTTTVNWEDEPLYWLEIEVDQACILYFDNACFNDGWAYTAPEGKLVIMRKSANEPPYDGYPFYVTYRYDPFKVTVPENIKNATARLAGVRLIDHFIGIREGAIGFEFQADTLLPIPDKETLYKRKGSLMALAKDDLAVYGYGWSGTAAK